MHKKISTWILLAALSSSTLLLSACNSKEGSVATSLTDSENSKKSAPTEVTSKTAEEDTSTLSPYAAMGMVGKPAPAFTLKTADGKEVSLADFKGKPVMLNFWASWCPPCRQEMPDIDVLAAEYKDKAVVIGVNLTQEERKADDGVKYFEKAKLKFPMLLDSDPNQSVSKAYRIYFKPTTFFIDKDGIIREVFIGAKEKENFAQQLNALLK
ncbi:TlpA family protein disulfide reductase [Heliobacterium chlorum]|uniref:TlpA family protein disulfide reductase n=1 Tax=Heliobacterium chlorum TaxID=2698 RepID=A0ABR7T017_HELCL|nr:TlpA disulfide reductase family protein [Heliobacterium chlorum]MBC9782916.1 TlpA family protein disulfide reductase [Heliobacterium chlorum]